MIKEIKIKDSKVFKLNDVTTKKFIPCSCDNCGSANNNSVMHADNSAIQP